MGPAPIWPASAQFDRLSGLAAIVAGVVAFLYAVAFIVLVTPASRPRRDSSWRPYAW